VYAIETAEERVQRAKTAEECALAEGARWLGL